MTYSGLILMPTHLTIFPLIVSLGVSRPGHPFGHARTYIHTSRGRKVTVSSLDTPYIYKEKETIPYRLLRSRTFYHLFGTLFLTVVSHAILCHPL